MRNKWGYEVVDTRHTASWGVYIFITLIFLGIVLFLLVRFQPAEASEVTLKASWYSISSLHKDGQWKITKGVCADGSYFNDNSYTCANRLYPLGTMLRITNLESGKAVIVKTTDRIGKRFARTRIDLSKGAFNQIANLKQGLVLVKVELLQKGRS